MRPIYLTSPKIYKGTIPLPMIQFKITAQKIDYQGCDTLMFTSKQAVVSANKIDKNWKNYPSIAIGPATAKEIQNLGGKLLYQAKDYYGSSLAKDIANDFRDRKILYLRPKEVSFDSKSFLAKAGIELKEQIIYETNCIDYKKEDTPVSRAVIVFTSPSTIKCFLKNFKWDSSYSAIVIGKSTLKHLPKNCNSYEVAKEPTIKACMERALLIANGS